MKINRFWKKISKTIQMKGQHLHLEAWGGSQISEAEAAEKASSRLHYIASQITTKHVGWGYGYSDTEIREPIIQEQYDHNDNSEWAITRNRYGALILNTQDVIFIDIDYAPIGFGFSLSSYSSKEALYQTIVQNLDSSDVDATIYETRGGFRLLVTDRLLSPNSKQVQELLAYFDSDELYALLCKKHECYRARLTPKPFYMGLASANLTVENYHSQGMNQWLGAYEQESANYTVCKLRQPSKTVVSHEIIKHVQRIHDQYCLRAGVELA